MFGCKCIHKDVKTIINSLIENEILRIKMEIERKEKIIRQQTEKGRIRSELLEHSYVIVAREEIDQLKDLKNDMNKIPNCFS